MCKTWTEQGNTGPVPEKPRSEANYKYKGKLNQYISVWSEEMKCLSKLSPVEWAAVAVPVQVFSPLPWWENIVRWAKSEDALPYTS